MTRNVYLCLLMILLLLGAVIAGGCGSANTEPKAQTITRTWVAVGTDGQYLIGQCAESDLRYCLDDSMHLVTAWDSCERIPGLPTPKPAGQQESFTFSLNVLKDRAYWFAIKVADSAGRWSLKSNCIRELFPAQPPPPIATLE